MSVAEDKAIRVAFDQHSFPMVLQSHDGDGGQVYLATRPPGLRLPDPQPSVEFVKRMADVERGSSEVYILPLETQQFTLPQACRDRKNVERLKAIASGSLE